MRPKFRQRKNSFQNTLSAEELSMQDLKLGEIKQPSKNSIFSIEELRMIRYLFVVRGYMITDIAKAMNKPYDALQSCIRRKKWLLLRTKADAFVIRRALRNQKAALEEILGLSAEGLKQYVTKVVQDGKQGLVCAKDAKFLSDIMANVFHVHQITKGEPTDIVKNIKEASEKDLMAAAQELIESIQDDPMYEPKDEPKPVEPDPSSLN